MRATLWPGEGFQKRGGKGSHGCRVVGMPPCGITGDEDEEVNETIDMLDDAGD
jgi:hypothetical protein